MTTVLYDDTAVPEYYSLLGTFVHVSLKKISSKTIKLMRYFVGVMILGTGFQYVDWMFEGKSSSSQNNVS